MSIKKLDSGKYRAQLGGGGSSSRKQKTFTKKSDAEYWLSEQSISLRQKEEGGFVPRMLLSEASNAFEKTLTSQTKRHVKQVLYDINYVSKKLNLRDLEDANANRLEEYLGLEHKMSPYSFGKKLKHFKSLLKFIERRGWFSYPGIDNVRTTFSGTNEKRALNKDEVSTLLAHLKVTSPDRWYPVVLLMISTGLRKKEVICLEWSDIDLETKNLRVVPKPNIHIDGEPCLLKTKNSNRSVPLKAQLVEVLARLPRLNNFVFSNKDGGHLSNNFKRDFGKVIGGASLVNIEKVTPHVMRHTFISHLLIYSSVISSTSNF